MGSRAWAMHIISYLEAFNHMPHVSPHPSKAARSSWSKTWSDTEHMGRYMKQSSAKIRICESTTPGKSFIWSRNNSGPRTARSDTPESTVVALGCCPSTTTCCSLFLRKLLSSLRLDRWCLKRPVSPTSGHAELYRTLWKVKNWHNIFYLCKS